MEASNRVLNLIVRGWGQMQQEFPHILEWICPGLMRSPLWVMSQQVDQHQASLEDYHSQRATRASAFNQAQNVWIVRTDNSLENYESLARGETGRARATSPRAARSLAPTTKIAVKPRSDVLHSVQARLGKCGVIMIILHLYLKPSSRRVTSFFVLSKLWICQFLQKKLQNLETFRIVTSWSSSSTVNAPLFGLPWAPMASSRRANPRM